jgi:hypothetical protein
MRTIDVLLSGFFGESNRGFLGIGSAALATVAGTLAVSSSMAQEGTPARVQTAAKVVAGNARLT